MWDGLQGIGGSAPRVELLIGIARVDFLGGLFFDQMQHDRVGILGFVKQNHVGRQSRVLQGPAFEIPVVGNGPLRQGRPMVPGVLTELCNLLGVWGLLVGRNGLKKGVGHMLRRNAGIAALAELGQGLEDRLDMRLGLTLTSEFGKRGGVVLLECFGDRPGARGESGAKTVPIGLIGQRMKRGDLGSGRERPTTVVGIGCIETDILHALNGMLIAERGDNGEQRHGFAGAGGGLNA